VTIPELMDRFGVDRIDLLKVDVEGAERALLASSGRIEDVDMMVIELHDRLQPGCTDAFTAATAEFGHRAERGENFLAAR
jgi:Methyltransferase FkbM domain